jgi:hypothetical protein
VTDLNNIFLSVHKGARKTSVNHFSSFRLSHPTKIAADLELYDLEKNHSAIKPAKKVPYSLHIKPHNVFPPRRPLR